MAATPPGGPWGQPPQDPYQQPPQQGWGSPPGYGQVNPYAPPANPYAAPGYGPMHMQQGASSRAQWALGLAIGSWLVCGVFLSAPALFMARAEISAIDRGESSPAGRSLAQGAFWCALANVALTVLALVFVLFFVVLAGASTRY